MMPPPDKGTDHKSTPPQPLKAPGMEKYTPLYGCSLFIGLALIGWGIFGYIQINWVTDFSSWQRATCHLESVQTITTHTSWDPLGIIDPQRLGTHASWGLGVYAIVRVNVTVPEGADPRVFRSGANDCGVITYTDECSCNTTCWKTRKGNMTWKDCPADPWCDISKAVPGPCVGNDCVAPQMHSGFETGKLMRACSNHSIQPEKVLPCWASPYLTVPQWKGRIADDDRSLYNERGTWLGVRFTPPDESCRIDYQYEDSVFATTAIGGALSICACCLMCACLINILIEDDESAHYKEKKVKQSCFPFCCFNCCLHTQKTTSQDDDPKPEQKWWRNNEESLYKEDLEYTSEEYTDGEWTDEEGVGAEILNIYAEGTSRTASCQVPESGMGDNSNEGKAMSNGKGSKRKKTRRKRKMKKKKKKKKKRGEPMEREVTFGRWYDHRLSN